MPLFEYSCRGCGHRFETLVMGNRTPVCPKCESSELDKQFSTFGMASGRSTPGAAAAPRFT